MPAPDGIAPPAASSTSSTTVSSSTSSTTSPTVSTTISPTATISTTATSTTVSTTTTTTSLPPTQSLRTIDPRTFAKSQPAAALALPASTGNDWGKKVSDLLAAQGGPSPKGPKDLLFGALTPEVRRALMALTRHFYQGCGAMGVAQADIHKILPVEDGLRGLVIGHYPNGGGGLRDLGTDQRGCKGLPCGMSWVYAIVLG